MSDTASALGLFSYSAPDPGAIGFKRFHDEILTIFGTAEVEPTYIAVEGVGYTGDFSPIGGRVHTKLLKSGFDQIQTLSIVANPKTSDEPGYDAFASASLSYVAETNETVLSLVALERFLQLGTSSFDSALRSLVSLGAWNFGFAFADRMDRNPEFHVLGLDDGRLKPVEKERLIRWYGTPAKDRVRKLRDVYPYNILNTEQKQLLGNIVETLGSLEKFEAPQLWLWKLGSAAIVGVRNQLSERGLLLS